MKSSSSVPPTLEYAKPVSDPWLRRLMVSVTAALGTSVTVYSGDRNFVPKGGSRKSHHLEGRAVDFSARGLTPEQIFEKLRGAAKSLPAPMGARYQILFHGKHTATGGAHVHIGRYHFLDAEKNARSGFDFWIEGDTRETHGKYRKVDSVDLGDGWASPFTR